MKTKFKYGISAYSGTIDQITFACYKNGAICIARKYVMPKLTENNAELGSVGKNLANIYSQCSEEYKSDLRTYADLYGREVSGPKRIGPNSYAIFVKLFYAFALAKGESVNLKSLSYSDLETLFPELTTIAASVAEGYLPRVSGSELLIQGM